MRKKNFKKEKGFTLVELLVSIAIFSIVMVVILGAVITIMDANRKARSLSLIMNNLDLAIESMTRSIKTGDYMSGGDPRNDDKIEVKDQYGKEVIYTLTGTSITKEIDSNGPVPITSPEIEISDFKIDAVQTGQGRQPRFIIRIKGSAKVGPRVTSEFSIQTTVSQRNLNI